MQVLETDSVVKPDEFTLMHQDLLSLQRMTKPLKDAAEGGGFSSHSFYQPGKTRHSCFSGSEPHDLLIPGSGETLP